MITETMAAPKVLDPTKAQKVSYCIPTWLRDEQIRVNTATVPGRLEPSDILHEESCAVVCYGPSLNDTWEQIKSFTNVMSCSGAHKFLIDRGIIPRWHVDVDPRAHKIALIGAPHKDVEYLIAATCHPDYFQMLMSGGFNVKLWHVFDGADEALRLRPAGDWALTGGCSVGLRALAVARFLGFRQLDVFGMDGSEGASGKHAAAHPNQASSVALVDYGGQTYRTTPAFLEAARQTAHELDDLKDVTARFHGEGLVQAMMRDYVRTPQKKETLIAFNKPALISEDYRRQNAQLHKDNLAYGVGAGRHADTIKKLVATLKRTDGLPPAVLDYGCGKGYLQKALSFPIFEYDPAIVGKDESAKPADLVCCLDVLEHIEPDKLAFVLDDLRRCVRQVGYFVIHTDQAAKTLPDGRNTHLIQEGRDWWEERLRAFFAVAKVFQVGKELHFLVAPLKKPKAVVVPGPAVALQLDRTIWRKQPYVIGCAQQVLDPELYRRLAKSFPPFALFREFGGGNRKWSLSQVNNRDQYLAFLASSPLWTSFYDYVKDPAFVVGIRTVLEAQGVDVLRYQKNLKTRFEFSMLPADGGCLRPHTDIPSKLVTLVVTMLPTVKDWDQAWGGGTDVLQPTSGVTIAGDYKAEFDAFDVVETYAYQPNQCVVFVKTEESWHGVSPMKGPAGAVLRKTLTINVEKAV